MAVVAVTGASGFIGMATCRALLRAGFEVRALVRRLPQAGVFPTAAKVIETGDLSTSDGLEAAVQGADTVIHLAARVPAGRGRVAPADANAFDVNVAASERLFRASARSGVRRFVYVSSVKAVGEKRTDTPWTENTPPQPTEPYGKSKLQAEEILRRVRTEGRTELVVVRPPVVYGPGVGGHFAALMKLAEFARFVPLPLAGLNNRRSTLFVHNLANALALLARHPAAADKTFFVSDGKAHSTAEIVKTMGMAMGAAPRLYAVSEARLKSVGRMLGIAAEIEKVSASLEVDDSLLRRTTGWNPPFTFEEAIAHTVGRHFPLVSPNTRG